MAELDKEIGALTELAPPLSVEEENEIRELSRDLPRVWNHPCSSADLKKRILRTVIKEIVVYLKDQKIELIIHWKGGEHTELEVLKNKSGESPLRTDVETKKIISELARIMPDKHMVAFLNRIGKTTAKGHTWNPVRLRAFRSNNSIAVYREGERQERGEFTVHEASVKLGEEPLDSTWCAEGSTVAIEEAHTGQVKAKANKAMQSWLAGVWLLVCVRWLGSAVRHQTAFSYFS